MERHPNMAVALEITYQMLLRPFRHPSTFRPFDKLRDHELEAPQAQGPSSTG